MRKLFTNLISAAALAWPLCVVAADDEPSVFDRLDANKDGVLAADEVDGEKKRLFERLLRIGDKDNDGKLTREEFAAASKAQPRPEGDAGRPDRPQPGGPEGRPDPKEIFKRFDANGDGKLSKEEVPEPMRENFGRIDANGDGQIDPEEFGRALGAFARRPDGQPGQPGGQRPDRSSIEQLFDRQDTNKDGKLTKEEAPEDRRERFEQMRERFDKDGDGALSKDEFVKGMMEQIERGTAARPVQPAQPTQPARPGSPEGRPPTGFVPGGPLMAILDADRNGELSKDELANAAAALAKLDKNGDGVITRDELFAAGGGAPPIGRPEGRPDAPRPDTRRTEGDRPDARKPEGARPDARREGARPDAPRPDARRPDAPRPEGDRPDARKPEGDRAAGRRTEGDTANLVRRLLQFDKNGDGKLSKEELPEGLRDGFARMDTNNDGVTDESELKQAATQLPGLFRDRDRPRSERENPRREGADKPPAEKKD